MKQITIFDTTLRDGEQALGHALRHGIESKIRIAQALTDMHVDIIEAGFPISSPQEYNAVRRVAEEIRGPKIAALARVNKTDIARAWDAVRVNPHPYIHAFSLLINEEAIGAYGKSMELITNTSVDSVQYARELAGKHDVQFSAQGSLYAISEALQQRNGQALEAIATLHKQVIEAGANIINLPDTEGKLFPHEAAEAIKWFKEHVPYASDVSIHVHCHNDLGNATANTIAAIVAGADCAEVTMNGIGERSGNAALEEVVMNIHNMTDRYNIRTEIDTKRLYPVSELVEYHTMEERAVGKPIVGRKAFQHSSGIHQDGNDKGKNTGVVVYQAGFTADTVGWTGEESRLTARSGKKGVRKKLERLGFHPTIEEVEEKIMPAFIEYADTRPEVTDLDLRILMNEVEQGQERIRYKAHSINKPFETSAYNGEVLLEIDGKEVRSTKHSTYKTNVGGIDAVFSAIDSTMPFEVPKLVLYDPRNIGETHDTAAEVTIVLSENGFDGNFHKEQPLYVGRATSNDTIEASIQAYISALNDYCKRNATTGSRE